MTYEDVKRLLLGLKVLGESRRAYSRLVDAIAGSEEMNDASVVAEFCRKKIRNQVQEEFHVITLNSHLEIIKDNLVAIGSNRKTSFSIQDVFRYAIMQNATGIIVWHTHPFSNYDPSEEDDRMTASIFEAGKLLGIRLVDSFVIPVKSPMFYSYACEKRLGEVAELEVGTRLKQHTEEKRRRYRNAKDPR